MVAIPLPHPAGPFRPGHVDARRSNNANSDGMGSPSFLERQDWTTLAAAGALIAGGALLVTGHKRAALCLAAAGTTLALIDEREAMETLRQKLPNWIRQAQALIDAIEPMSSSV